MSSKWLVVGRPRKPALTPCSPTSGKSGEGQTRKWFAFSEASKPTSQASWLSTPVPGGKEMTGITRVSHTAESLALRHSNVLPLLVRSRCEGLSPTTLHDRSLVETSGCLSDVSSDPIHRGSGASGMNRSILWLGTSGRIVHEDREIYLSAWDSFTPFGLCHAGTHWPLVPRDPRDPRVLPKNKTGRMAGVDGVDAPAVC